MFSASGDGCGCHHPDFQPTRHSQQLRQRKNSLWNQFGFENAIILLANQLFKITQDINYLKFFPRTNWGATNLGTGGMSEVNHEKLGIL
jgi:hypothetical protein